MDAPEDMHDDRLARAIADAQRTKTSLDRHIRELMADGREYYAREVAESWDGRPYAELRSAIKVVSIRLAQLERLGRLTSRIVPPDEHGRSQWVRRYYRRVA